MELKFRELIYDDVKREDCFFASLVEPVYNLDKLFKNDINVLYFFTTFLWATSLSKLLLKYYNNEINKFTDLFRP